MTRVLPLPDSPDQLPEPLADLDDDLCHDENDVEEWRPVPGWWPCEASSHGRVRGPSGIILKPYVAASGHLHVLIRRRKLRVHHAVLLAFGSPRPEGTIARHLNDDPTDNRIGNLRWGSHRENSADAIRNGRLLHGEAKPGCRLATAQVRQILSDRRPSRAVAADYGVSHTAVLRIRRGDRWRRAA